MFLVISQYSDAREAPVVLCCIQHDLICRFNGRRKSSYQKRRCVTTWGWRQHYCAASIALYAKANVSIALHIVRLLNEIPTDNTHTGTMTTKTFTGSTHLQDYFCVSAYRVVR